MSGILAWANATRTSLFFYKSVHASYPRLKNSWRSLSLKLDQGAYSSINWIRWRELISDKIFDSSLLSLGVVIFATGENELFVRSKSKWLLHSAFLAPEAGIPKPVVLKVFPTDVFVSSSSREVLTASKSGFDKTVFESLSSSAS